MLPRWERSLGVDGAAPVRCGLRFLADGHAEFWQLVGFGFWDGRVRAREQGHAGKIDLALR